MSNDYDRRLARAMEELEASAISRGNFAPPLFRLARALGLKPRPPHYISFARAALLTGPAFGLLWGAAMWALFWARSGMPMAIALLSSALAGVLFGLAMAGYYRWAGQEAGLSRWDDL